LTDLHQSILLYTHRLDNQPHTLPPSYLDSTTFLYLECFPVFTKRPIPSLISSDQAGSSY
jgi:hypothetical protein